jgi:hypothetical protein
MLVPSSANSGPRPSMKAFRPTVTLTEGAGGFLPGGPLTCLGRTEITSEAPALRTVKSPSNKAGAAWGAYSIATRSKPTPATTAVPRLSQVGNLARRQASPGPKAGVEVFAQVLVAASNTQ